LYKKTPNLVADNVIERLMNKLLIVSRMESYMVYFFTAISLLAIYFSARTSSMPYRSYLLEKKQVY